MNDSHNYLVPNNWWSELTTTGAATIKTVPPATLSSIIVSGTADAGDLLTMTDAARTEADDFWNLRYIKFGAGGSALNNGQIRRIVDFVDSSNTMTFDRALPAAITTEAYDIVQTAITWRLVVTAYTISANNTNGAIASIDMRHALNVNNTVKGWLVPATSGFLTDSNSDLWWPMEENETLALAVTTFTGTIKLTVQGKIFPSTTPLALKYLGDASN